MITLKFLLFLVYILFVFKIENYILINVLILVNCFIMVFFKISIKNFLRTLLYLIPFLTITFVFNMLLGNIYESFLIVIRLILAYIITYIFSKRIVIREIISFIEFITRPISILGINNKKIGVMVSVAISMIPILKEEIIQKIYALKSKGYKFKAYNINIIFKPIFISIFRKAGEIEKNLISKGYQE